MGTRAITTTGIWASFTVPKSFSRTAAIFARFRSQQPQIHPLPPSPPASLTVGRINSTAVWRFINNNSQCSYLGKVTEGIQQILPVNQGTKTTRVFLTNVQPQAAAECRPPKALLQYWSQSALRIRLRKVQSIDFLDPDTKIITRIQLSVYGKIVIRKS